MKKFLIIMCLATAVSAEAQTKTITTVKKPAASTNMALIKNSLDSFSYAMGIQVATYYKNQGATKVNSDLIKRAFDDTYGNRPLLLTTEQCNMTVQNKIQEFMGNKLETEKEKGKQFLAANKNKTGITELPSGLQYEVIKQGTGEKPKLTDTVKAHYIGTLIDGREFDNSYKRGEPLKLPVNGVIQGWIEALQMMPAGSKWKLYIPSDLAYGDRGAGGAIPGGAALVFEIELVEVVK